MNRPLPERIATLCVDGRCVGNIRIASSLRERTKGLMGLDGVDGALLLSPAASVHTFFMRFPIDVAYLDRHWRVLAVRRMRPWLIGRPCLRSRQILEAEAGRLQEWGIEEGSVLSVWESPWVSRRDGVAGTNPPD